MLQKVNTTRGTDPEGFFRRDGQIIGSEKIIPEAGVSTRAGKIVRDGIQFELNPSLAYHRDDFSKNLGFLLAETDKLAKDKGAELCWDGLVEVSRAELDSLVPSSQILGCQPSQNVYGAAPINVDAKEYRKRSAGGHLHVGVGYGSMMQVKVDAIPLFDIFVGNTMVLLDRDPGAAERRENYGRAGECRFPSYGLEYRTPSNFWLRDYSLTTLAYGLVDLAVSVMFNYSIKSNEEWDWLIQNVNIDNVILAINTNNWDLARQNLETLRPFFAKYVTPQISILNPTTLDPFIRFAEAINKNGIEEYFPAATIVQRWQQNLVPFETFIKRF